MCKALGLPPPPLPPWTEASEKLLKAQLTGNHVLRLE